MQNPVSFEFVNNYLPRRGNIIVKIVIPKNQNPRR